MGTIKKSLMILSMLAMTFMLSGCFFSEQEITINEEGKATISVSFWFDKSSAGDEGSIAIQALMLAFPELGNNYMMEKQEKKIGYTNYLVFTFESIREIDIAQNKYIQFTKKEDGSYYFEVKLPRTIEEISEQNQKALTIRVTLPLEIEMANSMNYEGRIVEWELRQNDFTKDIILKAFTKTTTQQIQSLRWPSTLAITFVEAVEQGNLELAYECWYDKISAKEAIRNLIEKEQDWGEWGPILTGHHVHEVSQDEYSISVPFINNRLSEYHIRRFNDHWLIISQNFMDFGMEDNREGEKHYQEKVT